MTVSATATPVAGRTVRYAHLQDNLGTLDITLPKGRQVERHFYFIEDYGADADSQTGETVHYRCFRLTKIRTQQAEGEPNNYDVRIDQHGDLHSCECMGFLRWGNCKHVSSLLALIQRGKI